MKTRIIVAAIGVPVLLVIFLLLPPVATAILCAALSGVGCFELLRAVGGADAPRPGRLGVMCAFAALNAMLFSYPDIFSTAIRESACLAAVVTGFFITILRYGKEGRITFAALSAGLFGAIAIPAAFSGISMLRAVSPVLALSPLVGAFMSDVGAYFAGLSFGKRKLAPYVSPNKTVAGCVGGFVGSVAGMCAFSLAIKWIWSVELGWIMPVVMGLVGSFIAQLGDLSFSVIKREFGVKDYGTIFPGHGGVLDRFDSVLYVAPTYWLLFSLWLA